MDITLPRFKARVDLTYALMIDDLDNCGQLSSAGVGTVDKHDAADLNKAPVGGGNACFTHDDGRLVIVAKSGLGQKKNLIRKGGMWDRDS